MISEYSLLDCGDRRKVEVFGQFKIIRPCPQAVWKPFAPELWKNADFEFVREKSEKGRWNKLGKANLPAFWTIKMNNLIWQIEPNEFGNIGVFTEHWQYSADLENFFDKNKSVLNLFSYSGSSCLNLIRSGFKVTVVDSSKNSMDLYSQNLQLNNFGREGQRLILEDAVKFCEREIRRDHEYNSIMVDAPSYGRGTKGEIFDIDEHIFNLLKICEQLLAKNGKMVITLHSPRYTVAGLEILFGQVFEGRKIEVAEILNPCESGINLPSGFLAKIGS